MLRDENGCTGDENKTEYPLPKIAPGAVCAQMVRCGKPNCKCARGELHGPYYYHFERVNGVLVKRYVKAKVAPRMRAACDARREKERERRKALQLSIRQLIKMAGRLREGEKLLLDFLEAHHG